MESGLALSIPLLPLLGFVVLGLFKSLSQKAVAAIAVGTVALSFLCGCVLFASHMHDTEPVVFTYFRWISAGPLAIDFALQLDQLSLLMTLIVTGVGCLIHWYATAYMAPHDTVHAQEHAHAAHGIAALKLDDHGYSRFFSYLNLFTGLMLILVLAANYVLMFVGWEGVGLASYLLIGFYYEKWSATQAGKKAFLVNRVGDFFFLTGLMLLLSSALGTNAEGQITASYVDIFARAYELLTTANYLVRGEMLALVTGITLCFFLGASGKSAQIPLFVWLPDAMEGPTPVSALIHAATMVTAGVYLIVRSSFLFLMSPATMIVIAIVAVLTAFFAATIAMTQYDIKRVLAYSTISQLGFMFIAAGLGAFIPAIFHLMTHAFFKACLFLGAGSVIHGMEHATGSHDPAIVQDMRHMGGLKDKMPITHWTMLVSCLAIAGFPLTAGFFSKDAILHEGFLFPFVPESVRFVVIALGYVTAFLTSVYMFRMYYLTFHGTFRGIGHVDAAHGAEHHAPTGSIESPFQMTAPLQILALLALVSGFLMFAPGFVPFEHYLAPVVHRAQLTALATREGIWGSAAVAAGGHHETPAGTEEHAGAGNGETDLVASTIHLPEATWGNAFPFYLISTLLAIGGILYAKSIWGTDPAKTTSFKQAFGPLYDLARNAWGVDSLYHAIFIAPGMRLFDALWKGFDEGFIDDTLVEGTGRVTIAAAHSVRGLQSGYLRQYAFYLVAGTVALLIIAVVVVIQQGRG